MPNKQGNRPRVLLLFNVPPYSVSRDPRGEYSQLQPQVLTPTAFCFAVSSSSDSSSPPPPRQPQALTVHMLPWTAWAQLFLTIPQSSNRCHLKRPLVMDQHLQFKYHAPGPLLAQGGSWPEVSGGGCSKFRGHSGSPSGSPSNASGLGFISEDLCFLSLQICSAWEDPLSKPDGLKGKTDSAVTWPELYSSPGGWKAT